MNDDSVMKRIFLFFMIFLAAACSTDDGAFSQKARLSISAKEIVISADAGLETFEINASTDWSIENIPDWCGTVRPSYGSAGVWEVRVRGRFYEEKKDRSAVLTVVAGDRKENIVLLQKGAARIDVSPARPIVQSKGGDVVLTVVADFEYDVHIPSFCEWLWVDSSDTPLDGEIVLQATPNLEDGDRTAVVEFRQRNGTYVKEVLITQTSVLSENRHFDSDVIRLQSAETGDGVNLLILGDGFIAEDLEFGGEFDRMVNIAYEAIFSIEPMASYRKYFNVYAVAAESDERGIGRVTAKNTALKAHFRSDVQTDLTMNLDQDAVYSYMEETGARDRINTAILVICNTDEVGGTNISYPDGRCIALCTKASPNHNGVSGVILHELVGHGIGRLDEQYANTSGAVTDQYKEQLAERHSKGWSLNIDTTDDPEQVAWSHFIGVPGYEQVGCWWFDGGVIFMGGGVCVPEFKRNDCMFDNTPYFNAPSREQIVKHIMEIAGVEYRFEDFIEQDKLRGAH